MGAAMRLTGQCAVRCLPRHPRETFDVVIGRLVLMHLPDPLRRQAVANDACIMPPRSSVRGRASQDGEP
jgi:hypothetical protein